MIIPLAIVIGLQKQPTLDQRLNGVKQSYDRIIMQRAEPKLVADGTFRYDDKSSKEFEIIGLAAGKTSIGIDALSCALLACPKDAARESRILDRIMSGFIKSEKFFIFSSQIPEFVRMKASFGNPSRIAALPDQVLQKSSSKSVKAPLLIWKANNMPEISDLRWDVYNRLIEEYAGTPAAFEARLRILERKNLKTGDHFTDFVSKDSEGKKFQLSNLRGKVVVLEFWANWCPSCQRTIPVMQGVEKEFAGQPVEFIGINSDGDAPVVKEIQAKWGMTTRTLVDGSPTGPISTRYAIMAWPSFFVIGKDGKVVFRSSGIDADGMTRAIKEASK